ncbi:hypothetical protein CsSME_00018879 [Camellia sinensis var. sinensis]
MPQFTNMSNTESPEVAKEAIGLIVLFTVILRLVAPRFALYIDYAGLLLIAVCDLQTQESMIRNSPLDLVYDVILEEQTQDLEEFLVLEALLIHVKVHLGLVVPEEWAALVVLVNVEGMVALLGQAFVL